MMTKSVLVTGASGGIGSIICSFFTERGWNVIGTGLVENHDIEVSDFIAIDMGKLADDQKYREENLKRLKELLPGGLDCLINNAAIQIVRPVERLSSSDMHHSLSVNVIAPFLLSQAFLGELQESSGSIINIASIHATLTKPHFAAYATTKCALIGLTKSLSVELGERVRVTAISPAATRTPMLEAGFDDPKKALKQLGNYSPTKTIADPIEVAKLAFHIASTESRALNGAIFNLDGGIGHRLHDPN